MCVVNAEVVGLRVAIVTLCVDVAARCARAVAWECACVLVHNTALVSTMTSSAQTTQTVAALIDAWCTVMRTNAYELCTLRSKHKWLVMIVAQLHTFEECTTLVTFGLLIFVIITKYALDTSRAQRITTVR